MRWKNNNLDANLQAAIEVLGPQTWEKAYKDSERLEYRVLRLNDYTREEILEIQAALDTLTINHTQKPMATFKRAGKDDYTPVLKVFNWSSIDNIVKIAKNPETTMLDVSNFIKRAAALTAFQRVFPEVDDFLSFQNMIQREEIKDHERGGIVLKLNLDNTTVEGLQEVLRQSGLNINLIKFSFEGGPETVFVPNAAFPDNVSPVTMYAKQGTDHDET